MFLASFASLAATRGGVWAVLHQGLMGGGQHLGDRGHSARGDGAIVGGAGSTVERSSTSKNRPSHHNYKSPKQFELKQSLKSSKITECTLEPTCLSRF